MSVTQIYDSFSYCFFFSFSYPLLNFSPLPGKIPTKVVLPYSYDVGTTTPTKIPSSATTTTTTTARADGDDRPPATDKGKEPEHYTGREGETLYANSNHSDSYQRHNFSSLPIPSLPWAKNEAPFVYVQQIILRSVVLPWNHKDLAMTDAFRGPLFEVFKLLEIISNHETNVTLSNLCLHVENVKRSHIESLFPEYNCLVLSPANFWRQNIHNFNKDTSLLSTIYKHHVSMDTKYMFSRELAVINHS